MTFDPSARSAYLTNGSTTPASGSISSYAIDVDTGVPTFVSSHPMAGAPALPPVAVIGLQ